MFVEFTSNFCIMQYTLKKSLGQHFLTDENMCKKIVAQITPAAGMQLLEIGPGGGAITKYILALDGIDYKAIEIDEEKVQYLLKHYPVLQGKILQQDILKSDAPFDSMFHVIGNFPYNISSPILFKIFEWEPLVESVIGMFQKEVAQRIAEQPGSKLYGITSVLTQTFFKAEYLFDVHEQCFNPPPKVKSGVIKLTNLHNPHHIDNKLKYFSVVKTAFNQRRKTLRNALKSMVHKHALDETIMSKRAEQLSVTDFVELYNKYVA